MKDRLSPRLSPAQTFVPQTVALVAILGTFSWLFGSALLSDHSFVYRDAAHYYDPLFEFTADEWSAGRVPLWNPYDGIGKPLLADTTSSVLYPGKLIFAMPLAFATNYKLYICGHVLLAAGSAFLLARRWGASVTAAAVCGLSYAFCGNVVFQYCNVVFLVGAAWLPLAVFCTDKMLLSKRIVWAPALGGVLALITFGGDPQGAYNAGLLAAGYALLLWLHERKGRRRATESHRNTTTGTDNAIDSEAGAGESGSRTPAPPCPTPLSRFISHRFVLLATAAMIGGVLAAAQILPAMAWSRRSHRAAYDVPRTLYELPGQIKRRHPGQAGRGSLEGLLAKSRPGEHLEHVYFFSFGPWRLAEYLWPNISGRQFPTHRRWIEAIPAEGLAWNPTCYMGLLPLLCAIGSLRLRGGDLRRRWMSWTVLLALLGSFGWYGIGWLVAEVCYAAGGDPANLPFGPAAGGVYWLMTVFLPGYVYFRYPAKLLIVVALGLSLLAARGWDRVFAGPSPGLRKTLLVLAALSLTAAAALWFMWSHWATWLSGVAPNVLFGPLDVNGAGNDVVGAFLHTAVVCGLIFCLLPRSQRRAKPRDSAYPIRPMLALILTATEIAIANCWLIPTAPRDYWKDPGPLATTIRTHTQDGTDSTIVRVDRAAPRHWFQSTWMQSGSSERQTEALISDNATLMPRFNLRRQIGVLDAPGTIVSQDYGTFLVQARWSGPRREGRGRFLHPKIQDVLSTDYAVLPTGGQPPSGWSRADEYSPQPEGSPQTFRVPPSGGKDSRQRPATPFAVLWQNERPHPRVWIAQRVARLDPLTGNDPDLVRRRTRDVLFAGKQFRDLRHTAVIETLPLDDGQLASINQRAGKSETADSEIEPCRLVTDQPQLVEVEVQLELPGLLVLNDFFDPGWQAQVTTTTSESLQRNPRLEVIRTNRVLRGVILPPGRHRIEFRYRPRLFYLGAIISAVGWLTLVTGTLLTWLGRAVRHHGVFTRRVA
jgi:hypothetical protein